MKFDWLIQKSDGLYLQVKSVPCGTVDELLYGKPSPVTLRTWINSVALATGYATEQQALSIAAEYKDSGAVAVHVSEAKA